MISFAQIKEDVLLWRCFGNRIPAAEGFYVDVGASDPEVHSVTKAFYDAGWRGINIEPSVDWYARLCSQRPRDVNVRAAAGEVTGEAVFHDIPGQQLGTMFEEFALRHVSAGMPMRTYSVPATTLSDACRAYAPGEIHFLKIDVEGNEAAVLRGMDFHRFRPWLLVIEATEPNRLDLPTHEEWEHLVVDAGYVFAYTDGTNRFYAANEHRDLLQFFIFGPDDYVDVGCLREIARLRHHLDASQTRVDELLRRLNDEA